ncbi:MAG: Undecaprenyl phosphate-alpha-4-amino-4-deoxy-L-arabinose arabinosyl transferase [Rhodocyclaceae bacterium]|nr:Undecaprenyl phosphate-alpha-4-amino-4-deoxy-L-arabinose arabinosyl transferase [Rhodocyclaceae bacterium]
MSRRTAWALLMSFAAAVTLYRIWLVGHLGIDLYVDEAYYWSWSKALDWGYYSKPPAIAAAIAMSTALFGDTALAVKAPAFLLYPATALVLAGIAQSLFGHRAALAAGVMFLSLPIVGALALFVSTDALLMFFWAAAMACFLHALAHGRWSSWLATGVLVGLGLLSKYTMAIFLPSALLGMLWVPAYRRQLATCKPWLAALVAIALLAPNLHWNARHGFPTFAHTADITHLGQPGGAGSAPLRYVLEQWLAFGPLLAPLLVWALLRNRPIWADPRIRMLVAMSLPLLGLVAVQALRAEVNGNWAAPALLALVVIAAGRIPGRWLAPAIALNLMAAAALHHWPDLAPALGRPLDAHNDPYKRARGWRDFGEAVAHYLRAHPQATVLASDRELLAETLFYARPQAIAAWRPQAHSADHYQLVAALDAPRTGDFLLLARGPDNDAITRHFRSSQSLAQVRIRVHADLERTAHIFLLRDFKGYSP